MAAPFRSMLLRQAMPLPVGRSVLRTVPAFHSGASVLSRTSAALQLQRATFQTSARRSILPPLPQKIDGGVNVAASVPEPEPAHGSYHWTFERLVSVALIPLTVAPFAAGSLSPVIDGTLIGFTIIHTYIGFQSCITDYFPKWRVPTVRKTADWLNFLMIFVCGWGFYEFETNDVGLTGAVKRIWKA